MPTDPQTMITNSKSAKCQKYYHLQTETLKNTRFDEKYDTKCYICFHEYIGDNATNTTEAAIYLVEGKNIKHKDNPNKEEVLEAGSEG